MKFVFLNFSAIKFYNLLSIFIHYGFKSFTIFLIYVFSEVNL